MRQQIRGRHADGVLGRGQQVAQLTEPAAVPAPPVDHDEAGLGRGAGGQDFPAPLDDLDACRGEARGARGRVGGGS